MIVEGGVRRHRPPERIYVHEVDGRKKLILAKTAIHIWYPNQKCYHDDPGHNQDIRRVPHVHIHSCRHR
jgi:hypothetical protein